jgi:hypothetical protein
MDSLRGLSLVSALTQGLPRADACRFSGLD